ncbi:cardiomyopathy-associated protein 5-like isoform X1 [Brienomyrus brachyistius]|uniref:cardiomyopathy-associated protein 5-like isoform X1 n=1 Tax=Brienomyrus brachyistius TaxID=42636 RepID=UPI0020B24538|nr:cardiomyopathy-associated protein 5-like isoform X1 [Brienomyrus brachyistius]
MDTRLEEGEQIQSVPPLTVLGDESIGMEITDKDAEVEEIANSLKDIVHDQDVKPKLQCIMVEPSFSMVTVQSEDSAIVWEAISTGDGCTSPVASTTSEGYCMESCGAPGQVIFVMDEDKRRKMSSSKSKPSEKSSRPVTAPSENVVPERPAMIEFSMPNIRPENTNEYYRLTDPKKDRDQALFSIISDGSEILNILVPSKLSTVDEEESLVMADNLFYLEDSPKIKAKQLIEETLEPYFEFSGEFNLQNDEDNAKYDEKKHLQDPTVDYLHSPSSHGKQMIKATTSGVDYFEKFTLMDECSPGEFLSGTEEYICSKPSEQKEIPEKQECAPEEQLDHFAASSDIAIANEYIDDIFYGSTSLDESYVMNMQEENEAEAHEQPKSPLKESGSDLFGSEETTLFPIFLSPGPPKIIDPILLEEPTAMSFLYSDLYAEAVGNRKTEDSECSEEVESVSSDSLQRRLSDASDICGYFEKFILIDETPVVEGEPVTDVYRGDGFDISALISVQATEKDKLCGLISVLKGGSESTEVSVSDLELIHGAVEEYCAGLKQSADEQTEETGKKIRDLYKQMTECMDENKAFKLEILQSQIGTIKESMESTREALVMELMKMEETSKASKLAKGN